MGHYGFFREESIDTIFNLIDKNDIKIKESKREHLGIGIVFKIFAR